MALYGTYRPKNFSDVVGQESIKTTLLHASMQNRVSHASLFCGTRGTGKTTSARIVAKALNCLDLLPNGDPCLKCDFCVSAEEGRMTDIIEIDAASNRGIDEIRDLREKVNFSPNFGKAKIYIIDEVHMLTKEAFNALLKTLEEPPTHAYFILATTEFHKVPETIRSRCQTFFFRKISISDIVGRLELICEKEGIKCDRKGIEIIAERANGGLRDAISLLEQSASYGEISEKNLQESLGMISEEIFQKFLETLSNGDSKKALSVLDALQDEGRNLEEFGKDFLGILRKKFHEFLHARDARLPWILQIIDIFETALQNCRSFDIPPLAFEIAIAKSMLLQKEFSDSLKLPISSRNEEEIIDNLVDEKHHIKNIQKKEDQDFVQTAPDFEKQKKLEEKIAHQREDNTPPWEVDAGSFPTEEVVEEIIHKEEVLEQKSSQKKSSQYDDDDMFPSSNSPSEIVIPKNTPVKSDKIVNTTSSQKEEKKEVSENPEISGDFAENVKKHWRDILSLLPKSVATMVKTAGKFSSVEGNIVSIFVESSSTRKLLASEKNIQKIQDVFSAKFEKNIVVEFIGDGEEVSSSVLSPVSESFSPEISGKNSENSPGIAVDEMEDLLKF